tara:strand:- start:732 stop:1010 length:279 start_codon:yes stop_codon:yes gene_type:complete
MASNSRNILRSSFDSAPPVTPERYTPDPDGDEPIVSINNTTSKMMHQVTYEITEQPGEEESSDGRSPLTFENEFKIATRELMNSRNDIVVSK